MKVYPVFLYKLSNERGVLQKIFRTKEQADAYCQEHKNEKCFYTFYWEEWEVM